RSREFEKMRLILFDMFFLEMKRNIFRICLKERPRAIPFWFVVHFQTPKNFPISCTIPEAITLPIMPSKIERLERRHSVMMNDFGWGDVSCASIVATSEY